MASTRGRRRTASVTSSRRPARATACTSSRSGRTRTCSRWRATSPTPSSNDMSSTRSRSPRSCPAADPGGPWTAPSTQPVIDRRRSPMPRHARRLATAASLAVLVIASVAGPTSATFPGRNGRLVFRRQDDNGVFQIWTANPDLTHQVQLTQGPDWDGWMPSWSPDGTRIAFSSHHDDPDPSDGTEIEDVYTMRADGTDVRQL